MLILWYTDIRTFRRNILEAIDIARAAVDAASDKQASNIVLLDVRGICSFADYFVICTGENERLRTVLDVIQQNP